MLVASNVRYSWNLSAAPHLGERPESAISPVAAHSGDRLLSEPTADTQPCRREPLFMPLPGM